MSMQLADDGTLDTVIQCSECATQLRYNFDPSTDIGPADYDARTEEQAYADFVQESIKDAEASHLCAVGYAHWASYIINGDASGFDLSNTPDDPDAGDREVAAADRFVAYLQGEGFEIVDVSSESFFATPDAGASLPGDCVHYIAARF